MVARVNRRSIRKLALVLVAAQLLCAPPIASALAALASATAGGAHCAELMPAGESSGKGSDHCPCCPDGGMNVAACLSACTASVGWISNLEFGVTRVAAEPV